MFQDINSVQDPNILAYIQAEQARILQKRAKQQKYQQPPPTSNSSGQYFNDIGGSGTDLPDY